MTQLHVHVVSALHLEPKDRLTLSSDPFVEVTFNGQTKRTSVIRDSLCPCWDEVLLFDFRPNVLTLNDILFMMKKQENCNTTEHSPERSSVSSSSSDTKRSSPKRFHLSRIFHPSASASSSTLTSSSLLSASNSTAEASGNISQAASSACSNRGSPARTTSHSPHRDLSSHLGYVHFKVFDYDRYKHNEPLGECYVPLGSIFDGYLLDEQWDGKPWWFEHSTPLLIAGKRRSKEHAPKITMDENDDQLTRSESIVSEDEIGVATAPSGNEDIGNFTTTTAAVYPLKNSLNDYGQELIREHKSPSAVSASSGQFHASEETMEHVLFGKCESYTKESFNYLFDEKVQELLMEQAKKPHYLEMELEKTSKKSFLIVQLYLSGIVRSRQRW
ncbi:hypothetical protein C9374_012343 [Naegleria lovaniensis]|uniref:C2 domain-containing protein n=1 Tax=Naegleria lovaniensis TaxID=51637 RepID=A0AA88GD21_NAELO|nr:uncharacterized protein C9374_012343 [Naegleria lovaniensis]KAG2373240.1 hypothetical protein C9374_012343 [Naegleria lovaniensis]